MTTAWVRPPERKTIRLKDYDYSQSGAYFITLCSNGHECLFGNVIELKMETTDLGHAVVESWEWLSRQYPYVTLDEWVVMPNHLHGIIIIDGIEAGGSRTAPTGVLGQKGLGSLIGAFKTVSTKRINLLRNTPALAVWQRNYYEHIIRDDREMDEIREYIVNNPAKWAEDKYNVPQ